MSSTLSAPRNTTLILLKAFVNLLLLLTDASFNWASPDPPCGTAPLPSAMGHGRMRAFHPS